MRKILLILVVILIGLAIASWVAWENKARLAAHYISSHLRVPVSIQTLDVTKNQIDIANLRIGTPPRSRTSTSFSAETIDIDTNVRRILKDPLIIDRIDIANIFIGLEYYENGQTNWDYMLNPASEKPKKKKDKEYLIKTLVLENLTVEVTQPNGQRKRYPTIARMEFHNISNETGFPIEEIEKAIFNLVIQDLMKKFNLLKQLPIPNSPLKYIPNF